MDGFGAKIKKLRQDRGITQKYLAEKLLITIPTLSHWECNYQEPSYKDLVALCKFFGVTADYLLGLEDEFGIKSNTYINNGTHNGNVNF